MKEGASIIYLNQSPIPPVRSRWPRHENDELEAVVNVLASGRVNALVHGGENRLFAQEFAQFVGADHALCVANGTVALEIALRALGVGPGDEVIVPARSFFATAGAVLTVGAMPVFADVCADNQNIDPASVERMIGPRTRAILCVHLAGWPCDMAALRSLADRHGMALIEDCAQAHGAAIDGQLVGSFGDAAAFSFCTDKIMSTGGEGGVVLFRDKAAHDRAWPLKDHGKNPAKLNGGNGQPGEFRYIHDFVGSNLRLTEMQAAIGRRQLAKLPVWLERRRHNASLLAQVLAAGHDRLRLYEPAPGTDHAWYKFYVQLAPVDAEPVEAWRTRIIEALNGRGIPVGTGSCPDMSREQALADTPIRRDRDLPNANALGRRTLMFPVDHTLNDDDMIRMGNELLEALDA